MSEDWSVCNADLKLKKKSNNLNEGFLLLNTATTGHCELLFVHAIQ